MDRTRADDDKEPAILVCALNDFYRLVAAVEDCSFRLCGLWDFMLEEIRRSERIVAAN